MPMMLQFVDVLNDIHEWFSQLCSKGPAFGYYPEPSKSYLLVNDRYRIEAERLFGALGIQIVAGHRFWVVIWVIMLAVNTMYLTRFGCGLLICCLLQRLL